jgi:hypothetical protein
MEIKWKNDVDQHDYLAAYDYLTLVMSTAEADRARNGLLSAPLTVKKGKDILRASRLPLLREDNHHVKKDIKKLESNEALSPILLVVMNNGEQALIIADGYHRLCAAYLTDEDLEISCKITYL